MHRLKCPLVLNSRCFAAPTNLQVAHTGAPRSEFTHTSSYYISCIQGNTSYVHAQAIADAKGHWRIHKCNHLQPFTALASYMCHLWVPEFRKTLQTLRQRMFSFTLHEDVVITHRPLHIDFPLRGESRWTNPQSLDCSIPQLEKCKGIGFYPVLGTGFIPALYSSALRPNVSY